VRSGQPLATSALARGASRLAKRTPIPWHIGESPLPPPALLWLQAQLMAVDGEVEMKRPREAQQDDSSSEEEEVRRGIGAACV
jgi:hypothetical protein